MKTSGLFVRIDPQLKKDAEKVFSNLGTTMSSAITVFLRQVVMQNGFPFEVKVFGGMIAELMTEEEMRAEIAGSRSDLREGKGRKASAVFDELDKKYKL